MHFLPEPEPDQYQKNIIWLLQTSNCTNIYFNFPSRGFINIKNDWLSYILPITVYYSFSYSFTFAYFVNCPSNSPLKCQCSQESKILSREWMSHRCGSFKYFCSHTDSINIKSRFACAYGDYVNFVIKYRRNNTK